MTPAEQKAYQAANAAKGKKFEKEQDDRLMKPMRDVGEASMKGMEEGRMDPMGNSYKAGGFVQNRDMIKKHAAGFKCHNDHVKAMCMGGRTSGNKVVG